MIRGVSSKTFKNLQLGEGAFLKSKYLGTEPKSELNAKTLSATRGGATISITPVYRTRTIDGVPVNTMEARVIDYVTVSASFTALEVTPELLKMAGGGADYDETREILKLRHSLTTSDFGDLYWVGDVSDGRRVQITFKNALNTNGIQLKTAQYNEGELSMSFEGNYSVEDLDTPPVEIEFFDVVKDEEEGEETENETV